jgi:hypothetical protein
MAQAYYQTPWRKQVQIIGLVLLCVLFTVLIASIYLNVSARAAVYGREILLMQDEIQQLQLDNADLKTRLGILLSSKEMEARALEMGFVPIEKGEAVYVVVPGYVARQPAILTSALPQEEVVVVTLPRRFTESLADWLKERLMLPEQSAETVQ